MVKGTKRKIPIEKITNKNSVATCFTKRRDGLYSKASQLCLLSDAQIAIIATPSSSQSNVSFFSFGHSSVDAVVSAYLGGKRLAPVDNKRMREDIGICLGRKDLGLGFWWEDEALYRSENLEELKEAVESMEILFRDVKKLMGETLIPDECLKTDDDQNERNCFGERSNQDKYLSNRRIHDDCLKADTEMVVLNDDQNLEVFNKQEKDVTYYEGFQEIASNPYHFSEIQGQILVPEELCLSDNTNCDALSGENYLNECSNEDIDQLIDYDSLLSDDVMESFREFDASHVMNSEVSVVDDVSTDPNLFSEAYVLQHLSCDVFEGLDTVVFDGLDTCFR